MDHVETMQIANCSSDLPEVEGRQTFLAVVFVPDFLEKTPVGGKFKKKIDFVAI